MILDTNAEFVLLLHDFQPIPGYNNNNTIASLCSNSSNSSECKALFLEGLAANDSRSILTTNAMTKAGYYASLLCAQVDRGEKCRDNLSVSFVIAVAPDDIATVLEQFLVDLQTQPRTS